MNIVPGISVPSLLTQMEFDQRRTDRATWVINASYKVAKKRNHPDWSASHIIYGVALFGTHRDFRRHTIAGDALLDAGVLPKRLKELPQLKPMTLAVTGDLFMDSVIRTVEVAYGESAGLNHIIVTEDHLFLAAVQDPLGFDVLRTIDVDVGALTQYVLDRIPEQVRQTA